MCIARVPIYGNNPSSDDNKNPRRIHVFALIGPACGRERVRSIGRMSLCGLSWLGEWKLTVHCIDRPDSNSDAYIHWANTYPRYINTAKSSATPSLELADTVSAERTNRLSVRHERTVISQIGLSVITISRLPSTPSPQHIVNQTKHHLRACSRHLAQSPNVESRYHEYTRPSNKPAPANSSPRVVWASS
jgi:hypothetical protein